MRLTEDCLDKWAANYNDFSFDFLLFAQSYTKVVGYWFEHDGKSLEIVHANWVAQCERWEKTLVMPDSKGLSHIKMMAILLTELASLEWLSTLHEYDGEDRNGYDFNGTAGERDDVRGDIRGAGGTYLAFEFAMLVINYFEEHRIDRVGRFVFRATPDVIHDTLVYLLSDKRDAVSTFLVLNAMYTRPNNGNGH